MPSKNNQIKMKALFGSPGLEESPVSIIIHDANHKRAETVAKIIKSITVEYYQNVDSFILTMGE